jgi:hypothetical protein
MIEPWKRKQRKLEVIVFPLIQHGVLVLVPNHDVLYRNQPIELAA